MRPKKDLHPVFRFSEFLNRTTLSLTSAEISILFLLSTHGSQAIYPSLSSLAKRSQLGKRQLIRVIKSLENKTLIKVCKYRSKHGEANAYHLLFLSTTGDTGDTSLIHNRCPGCHLTGDIHDTSLVTSMTFDTYDRSEIEKREKGEKLSADNFYADEEAMQICINNELDLEKELTSFKIKQLPKLIADNFYYQPNLHYEFKRWLEHAIKYKKRQPHLPKEKKRPELPVWQPSQPEPKSIRPKEVDEFFEKRRRLRVVDGTG